MVHEPVRPLRLSVVQYDVIQNAVDQGMWTPAEPALDPRTPTALRAHLPELSLGRLFADSGELDAYQHVQDVATNAVAARLSAVLSFLDRQQVDVAVFPEYLIPVDLLHLLLRFSAERAVIAGLGYIRNHAEALKLSSVAADRGDPADLVGRNVSVLAENGRAHLNTKAFPADGETAMVGTGPSIHAVSIGDREMRIGVAVCKDHLRSEDFFRQRHADIVCIPAYSSTVQPFYPDAPRDYVRLFANCARFGGSAILLPGLAGHSLGDRLGVRPINAGHEAVVVVEYDRYPQRPTALAGTRSQLVLRSEIIDDTLQNRAALDAFAEDLNVPGPEQQSRLNRLIEGLTTGASTLGPFAEAVLALRRLTAQGLDGASLSEVARTHLAVTPDSRPQAVRAQQSNYVVGQLERLHSRPRKLPIGAAHDLYSQLTHEFARVDEPTTRVQAVQVPSDSDLSSVRDEDNKDAGWEPVQQTRSEPPVRTPGRLASTPVRGNARLSPTSAGEVTRQIAMLVNELDDRVLRREIGRRLGTGPLPVAATGTGFPAGLLHTLEGWWGGFDALVDAARSLANDDDTRIACDVIERLIPFTVLTVEERLELRTVLSAAPLSARNAWDDGDLIHRLVPASQRHNWVAVAKCLDLAIGADWEIPISSYFYRVAQLYPEWSELAGWLDRLEKRRAACRKG